LKNTLSAAICAAVVSDLEKARDAAMRRVEASSFSIDDILADRDAEEVFGPLVNLEGTFAGAFLVGTVSLADLEKYLPPEYADECRCLAALPESDAERQGIEQYLERLDAALGDVDEDAIFPRIDLLQCLEQDSAALDDEDSLFALGGALFSLFDTTLTVKEKVAQAIGSVYDAYIAAAQKC
jgi:hypothetical protein